MLVTPDAMRDLAECLQELGRPIFIAYRGHLEGDGPAYWVVRTAVDANDQIKREAIARCTSDEAVLAAGRLLSGAAAEGLVRA